ncbi:fragile X mental retardation syndrome-related protein 1 homolog [Nilaparvata lugens]|uniref:fragile X mental retardation syndrome-related protein 1 homolog n=1 Tax=Nilaparvata lugens TaxID=108931 RepID=UPI00193CF88F|nr:fragile X mental retardation syndrome-related protein 1 homolog [Nilaparvata lugens]
MSVQTDRVSAAIGHFLAASSLCNPLIIAPKSKMDDLEVEVCGEIGAYYKAYVTDVFEKEVSVVFENE